MEKIVSFFVSAFFLVSAPTVLTGCGSDGSGSPGTAPTSGGGAPSGATYGNLTLSGTGTGVTGTTFNARTRLAISGSGITTTQWYNIDLAAGTTYPYVVLAMVQDSMGTVTGVTLSNMINSGTASDQWVIYSPPTTEVSITATTVTFTNLVVPGYAAAGTTTSLTLNGTLNF